MPSQHTYIHREHLILFNPVISPQTKEFSIRRMIAAGLLSQFMGNVVSLASHNDAWIFNGLTKFLQYFIAAANDDDISTSHEIFINEVLHTTMHRLHDATEDAKGKFKLFQCQKRVRYKFIFSLALFFIAACIFHMIYRTIGSEAFSIALQRLIAEKYGRINSA